MYNKLVPYRLDYNTKKYIVGKTYFDFRIDAAYKVIGISDGLVNIEYLSGRCSGIIHEIDIHGVYHELKPFENKRFIKDGSNSMTWAEIKAFTSDARMPPLYRRKLTAFIIEVEDKAKEPINDADYYFIFKQNGEFTMRRDTNKSPIKEAKDDQG